MLRFQPSFCVSVNQSLIKLENENLLLSLHSLYMTVEVYSFQNTASCQDLQQSRMSMTKFRLLLFFYKRGLLPIRLLNFEEKSWSKYACMMNVAKPQKYIYSTYHFSLVFILFAVQWWLKKRKVTEVKCTFQLTNRFATVQKSLSHNSCFDS